MISVINYKDGKVYIDYEGQEPPPLHLFRIKIDEPTIFIINGEKKIMSEHKNFSMVVDEYFFDDPDPEKPNGIVSAYKL